VHGSFLLSAGALAALDLVMEEEEVGTHNIFGDHFLELISAVRGYIKSTEAVRS
jgi:hypothetical protein